MVTCEEYVSLKREELRKEIAEFKRKPCLVVIQIGSDKASNSYVKSKSKACEKVGIEMKHHHIEYCDNFYQSNLINIIKYYSFNENVDGIIVQLPLPEKYLVEEAQYYISKEKDVDGFKRDSYFAPCTPKGIIDYLEANKVDFSGKNVVVIGRSKIVGQPLVNMFINRGATVTCCNSKTKDIKHFTHNADIVVSAIGKSKFFDESYFRHGQIIVDVGINRDENGKLCGDVCKEVADKVKLLTPVPKGVGLLTVTALLENVVAAYKFKNNIV